VSEAVEKKALSKAERLKIPRQPMPEQDPRERAHNFDEVPLGYTPETAMIEASRCLACGKAQCIAGCPVAINIPKFLQEIAEGDFKSAARTMREANLLPSICGRVCPQEEQCEAVCVTGKKGEPVAIGRLERFIGDWERETGEVEVPARAAPTGKRVAVVGSGPAGLTVAADLARLGHEVVIFEAFHKPGGVLVYGIPEFRLPKAIIEAELSLLEKMGIEIRVNQVIGMTDTIDELLTTEGFDAVFIGTGAGLPWFMGIPGENACGVYSANEFLTRVNLMKAYEFPASDTPIKTSKAVATVGGGNVAMDSARTALRLGAERSIIVYRRGRKEMPARAEEIHHAEEEGVEFMLLTNPTRVLANEDGWVKGLECLRMELGEPDASGRRRPVPIPGSEFVLEVDTVVMAIGNSPNPLIKKTTPGIETTKGGEIVVNMDSLKTTKRGVFAGGDIVRGAATVILAMGDGRVAARAIDEYLRTGEW
jgi:glutamate synthase (NADPH/NADH) small chain